MKQEQGYEQRMRNTGAQEVLALRKGSGVKKGTSYRGKDFRSGK